MRTPYVGPQDIGMTFLRAFSLLGALVLATATRAAGTPLCSDPSPPGRSSETVQTIQTTLAGVPAILRIPKSITKPPIVLWHGLGPPASEADLMEDLPLDEVPALKNYIELFFLF